MDQPIGPITTVRNHNYPLIIALSVLLAALITGGAVYAYEHSKYMANQTDLQAQVNALKAQLAALPTATPTPVPSTTPTPTTTPKTSPTATATVATCQTDNLTISLTAGSGAAGTYYYNINLKNKGTATCTISGSPKVVALDANGTELGNTTPATHTAATVTLATGATAYSTIGFPAAANFTTGVCKPMKSLVVYPPNQTTGLTIPNIDTYSSSYTSEYCQTLPVTDFAASIAY